MAGRPCKYLLMAVRLQLEIFVGVG